MALPFRACVVGAALGSVEVIWVLSRLRSVPPLQATLLWLYGGVGSAAAAAAVGLAAAACLRARRRAGTFDPARLAAGVGVGTLLSIHLLAALLRLRQPQLAWLLPGCVLSGAAGGLLVFWIARTRSRLRSMTTWAGLNAIGLIGGLAFVALNHTDTKMQWYSGTVATAAGIALVAALLKHWRIRPRRAVVVCNAGLYLAIMAMPVVVSGLDRLAPVAARPGTTPPNVLLISVDTLRSDRLGCYGYRRANTPNIDALARTGVLFEQATSPVSLTGPSHTTMLTGLYPVHHGATFNGVHIRADVQTVPDVLSRRGYRTAAFVSGWPLKDAAAGLAGHFDYYDEDFAPSRLLPDVVLHLRVPQLIADSGLFLTGRSIEQLERRGGRTTDRILSWLAQHRNRPVFVFAHYYDPHAPYAPPPPYDRMHDPEYRGTMHEFRCMQPLTEWQKLLANPREIEHVKALYDGEISYTDAVVGRLLDGLTRLGLAESTVVILTADHGESLTEHGFYFDHAEYLYETDIHVPLLMRFPGDRYAGTHWSGQVGLVDIAPTVLELTGMARAPVPFDGRSLLPILNGAEPAGQRISYGAIQAGKGEDRRSRYYVRDRGYKLIWNFDRRERLSPIPAMEELYDLTADPAEAFNMSAQPLAIAASLRAHMAPWVREKPEPASAATASVAERLRALGY